MDISKQADQVQKRIARSILRVNLINARAIERRTRNRQRRKTGPSAAEALAMLRDFKQQLARFMVLPPDPTRTQRPGKGRRRPPKRI